MEAKQADKPQVQLPPNALYPFEHVSTRHAAVVQQGVKPEDMLAPAFWAHQALKLRPYDEIRVHCEDGSWMANVVVLDCSRTWAKVIILNHYPLTTGDVSLTQASEQAVQEYIAGHTITFRGQHKWSIVRKSDKNVLFEGIEMKDEALKKLELHARSTLGVPAAAKPAETVAT